MSGKKAAKSYNAGAAGEDIRDNIVVSDSSTRNRLSVLRHLSYKKRGMSVIAVLSICMMAGTLAWYAVGGNHAGSTKGSQETDRTTYQISDKSYGKVHAQAMKTSSPQNTAPVGDIVDYYDELLSTEFTAQEYDGVIKDYNVLLKKAPNHEYPISVYMVVAKSYIETGDNSSAKTVLDTAAASVHNYSASQQATILEQIALVRKETESK